LVHTQVIVAVFVIVLRALGLESHVDAREK